MTDDENACAATEPVIVSAVYKLPVPKDDKGRRDTWPDRKHADAIEAFWHGEVTVTFLMDGTEKIDGTCAVCVLRVVPGPCPGVRSHVQEEWLTQNFRARAYAFEMARFTVPAEMTRADRLKAVKLMIIRQELHNYPVPSPE